MKQLVIIRGRPGAGKSTVARIIQDKLKPTRVAIFTPDYFYWQVCPGEDNKHLVNQVLNYAIQEYLQAGYLVILEGILPANENGGLFEWLKKFCQKQDIKFNSFFLELPLEKAIERNQERGKGTEISDQEMETWHTNAQPNEIEGERVIKVDDKAARKVAEIVLEHLS